MPKNYNLLSLTPEEASELFHFFENQAIEGISFWPAGSAGEQMPNLSHSILRRERNSKPGEFRYEVIEQPFSSSDTSSISNVLDTLTLSEEGVVYKSKKPAKPGISFPKPPRVVKSIYQSTKPASAPGGSKHDVINQLSPAEMAQREFAMSQQAGHLHIKKPLHTGEVHYLVRRKAKGELLSTILIKDVQNSPLLTTEQRIKITIALLKALKEQVTDKKIIHRDIKPLNIVIDQENYTATIFDFALSTPSTEHITEHSGSRPFCSPEVFFHQAYPQTEKMDVFSMARVIAMLWRIDEGSYNLDRLTHEQYMTSTLNTKSILTVNSLFNGIDKVTSHQKSVVTETLRRMLEADPANRCSINEALILFNEIDPKEVLSQASQGVAKMGLYSSSPPTKYSSSPPIQSWMPSSTFSTSNPK